MSVITSAIRELSPQYPPCLASAARDLVEAYQEERLALEVHGYGDEWDRSSDDLIEARKLFLSALRLNGVDPDIFERAI